MKIYDLQAMLFKALSHPVRIRILEALEKHNSCVNDMTRITGETQPQVSRHLKALKEAGFLKSEKNGNSICYSIKSSEVNKMLEMSRMLLEKGNREMMDIFKKGGGRK
ncbi:MAG: ArsR/SmtB family transcription factor [Candidatus Goldiibacteriota bacterium]